MLSAYCVCMYNRIDSSYCCHSSEQAFFSRTCTVKSVRPALLSVIRLLQKPLLLYHLKRPQVCGWAVAWAARCAYHSN